MNSTRFYFSTHNVPAETEVKTTQTKYFLLIKKNEMEL